MGISWVGVAGPARTREIPRSDLDNPYLIRIQHAMRDINTKQNPPLPVVGSACRGTVFIPFRGQPYGIFDNTTGSEPDLAAAGGRLNGLEFGGAGKRKTG